MKLLVAGGTAPSGGKPVLQSDGRTSLSSKPDGDCLGCHSNKDKFCDRCTITPGPSPPAGVVTSYPRRSGDGSHTKRIFENCRGFCRRVGFRRFPSTPVHWPGSSRGRSIVSSGSGAAPALTAKRWAMAIVGGKCLAGCRIASTPAIWRNNVPAIGNPRMTSTGSASSGSNAFSPRRLTPPAESSRAFP